ncbi:transglutaminase family protein [Paenibacillus pasadenensis]|uniref:Protein containing transglutaminase-like domain, putative cysteine protease n=1 Tax=Paenibacillus pasadenensis TaxID=217090 RepID=A0A2N5NA21_9BACL|nr:MULTISPECIES: transglutaminase family protein [Paenibacillus]PLT47165.1 Protein containing transglutaminase-like domain, putative cysteine protease [Paenibacillus pasadenensis]QGG57489.1 transglutaminase family protein [Paenibacillus sp. B01]
MKLRISHVTTYRYSDPVRDSVNEIRLTPVTNKHQSCYQHSISVEPNAPLLAYEDAFGNKVHAFTVNAAHRSLTVRTHSIVTTKEPGGAAGRAEAEADAAWSWLGGDEALDRFAEYLLPTGYTEQTAGIRSYTDGHPPDERGVGSWLERLCGRIRDEFIYDPLATTVQTKASDLLQTRRGVCQDFAHLMIACCRCQGVPARYVSGYHFVGDLSGGNADFEQASHAWVEAYVPGAGWRGYDPTNASLVGERYVKLGHGLDYRDIVPFKGVYLGSGVQTLEVHVDVSPAEE